MPRIGELRFSVAVLLVGGIAAGGVIILLVLGMPAALPVPFVAATVVAVWYLFEYSRVQAPRDVEEPFDDPVEVADREDPSGTGDLPKASDAPSADSPNRSGPAPEQLGTSGSGNPP